ncbi:hypothetical protein [uncultured Roseovarius sp.]|uniref:hypothetical protein n=1 Tax=uncultured Roseovarius sp. TaxID=293344 RepID=UPI0025FAC621|nr:hypothetical protein [uncultured Roseovarius sp.]
MTQLVGDLVVLTEALYRSKLAELEPVLVEERRLRRALAELDEKTSKNAAVPADELTDLQRLGGDMMWRAWVAESRAELQIRLAQVLARKAEKMAALCKSFGKAEAVSILNRRQAEVRKALREKATLEEIQSLMLLKSGQWSAPTGLGASELQL